MMNSSHSILSTNVQSIYIHIPFCQKKCSYCDFYSIERVGQMQEFVDALRMEITLQLGERYSSGQRTSSDTIFFGGGTPSLLTPQQLESILNTLSQWYSFDSTTEFTLECNPGTVSLESLRAYRELGVNRLSFGVQSFNENELHFLERIHSPEDAKIAFDLARRAGFTNLNCDLMFALPHQTLQSYTYSLEQALQLGTEHISAYSLIYEEGTPLYAQLLRNEVTPLDEEIDTILYEHTMKVLAENGYHQYEVSNFSKNGKRCRHNLAYWSAKEYVAFGPSAHGYSNGMRYWNYRNLTRYMDAIRRNEPPIANAEKLSSSDQFFEQIFLGLRSTGINLSAVQQRFGFDVYTLTGDEITLWIKEGLMTQIHDQLSLTAKGYTLCDEITVRFLASLEKKTGMEWQQHEYVENDTDIPLPIIG